MKRRNSQFRIFFGHGSKCKHEAPVGTQESAVSNRDTGLHLVGFLPSNEQRTINILHYGMTEEKIF